MPKRKYLAAEKATRRGVRFKLSSLELLLAERRTGLFGLSEQYRQRIEQRDLALHCRNRVLPCGF